MSLVAAASAHLESRYTLVLLTYLGTCAVLVVTNVVRALSFGGGADAATRAKWLVLAAASLGATWYYMFAFLARSYSDYADGVVLKACSPAWSAQCAPTVAAWLRDTRLFEQAWGHVVSGATQWWWSSEVCLLAVGAWIVKGREESALDRLPNLFLLMLLGQAVAVSVALCLTFLTLAQTPSVSFRPTQPGRLFIAEMALMAAGAYSVTEPPTTLLRLAAMHAPPLVLSFLPARPVRRKVLYAFLFLYSLMIRYNLSLEIRAALPAGASFFATLRDTLWSHPAQSSIGLDNVCSTVAVAAYVLQERSERKGPQSTAWILALLAPVLGPSAILAAWGGLRSVDREIFVGPEEAAAAEEKKEQ